MFFQIFYDYMKDGRIIRKGALSYAGMGVTAVAVVLGLFLYADGIVRDWAHSIRSPGFDVVMRGISEAGLGIYEAGVALIFMGAGYLLRSERTWGIGKKGLIAVAVSGIGVQFIKHLVGRPRPRLLDSGVHHVGPSIAGGMDSFPSGHTITAFALAVVLAKGYPSWKIPIYGLACLIGFSRIYLDSHFASDVFAGAVLGVWIGWVVSRRKEIRNY